MRLPLGSSGYRNPPLNSWNGTKLRNSLQMGRDGGKGDGNALDPPSAKRQLKSQLASKGTSGPQTRLRWRPTARDSSSAPTHHTRGGSRAPSYCTRGGWNSAPSCRTRGGSTAELSCRTQGGSTAGRPALQSFLRQIPWRRNRYNCTLHRKSRLRWWTYTTTPTKWLRS
jgi:hypothetical protein